GATALLVFFRRADALVSAAGFTAAAGVGMCAVHPTAAIAGTVLLLAAAPRLSIALARIHVPFIPTAGQDLDITDEPDRRIEQKSVQAHQFYLGICAGIALSGALAGTLLAIVPTHHSWITMAVCLSATVSVLVHAARHRHAFATWTLMALASVLTVTAVWILTRLTALPLGIVVGLAALSTPWWATKPALLSPTAVSWFERCEIIAIVILLPLAAQASGLFSFIRGLG
ncbi:MAG: type VII secretion integral membrane protein EccD, partial [Corynebacterium sp.]|nr:type VII secretion integral membrane protein EccD [Corynebacterium sp.]